MVDAGAAAVILVYCVVYVYQRICQLLFFFGARRRFCRQSDRERSRTCHRDIWERRPAYVKRVVAYVGYYIRRIYCRTSAKYIPQPPRGDMADEGDVLGNSGVFCGGADAPDNAGRRAQYYIVDDSGFSAQRFPHI